MRSTARTTVSSPRSRTRSSSSSAAPRGRWPRWARKGRRSREPWAPGWTLLSPTCRGTPTVIGLLTSRARWASPSERWADRARCLAPGPDRSRRGARSARRGARRILDHAAQAQSGRRGRHAGGGDPRARPRGHLPRRHAPGARAGPRRLAGGVGDAAGAGSPRRRRGPRHGGRSRRSRGGSGPHAREPRPDARARDGGGDLHGPGRDHGQGAGPPRGRGGLPARAGHAPDTGRRAGRRSRDHATPQPFGPSRASRRRATWGAGEFVQQVLTRHRGRGSKHA